MTLAVSDCVSSISYYIRNPKLRGQRHRVSIDVLWRIHRRYRAFTTYSELDRNATRSTALCKCAYRPCVYIVDSRAWRDTLDGSHGSRGSGQQDPWKLNKRPFPTILLSRGCQLFPWASIKRECNRRSPTSRRDHVNRFPKSYCDSRRHF